MVAQASRGVTDTFRPVILACQAPAWRAGLAHLSRCRAALSLVSGASSVRSSTPPSAWL
ncbi:MAG: hypothetical protein EPN69_12820 [Rhodanobacter sp.]|nr:MAG: hypothetical protein EPN69_12820 [Rhodanobacter sp.]TAM05166.1 MAG: hypothetical protein EPN71_02105 [Rhodanobacter sp.]TAM38516.1 MAG: hypothetical protein EPN58_16670 [Rhodanobacter sp.]